MTGEQIEHEADEYIAEKSKLDYWHKQSWNCHLRDFAIEQVNLALEEAAKKIPEIKCLQAHDDACVRCSVQAIRALKIGGE